MLLREYYELCEGGVCQDLLSESEKKFVAEGGFAVTTRRAYSTTKDLLEKTDNYKESCYVAKDNIQIEYQYALDTQTNNLNLMGLSKSRVVDLEKYCKYTK